MKNEQLVAASIVAAISVAACTPSHQEAANPTPSPLWKSRAGGGYVITTYAGQMYFAPRGTRYHDKDEQQKIEQTEAERGSDSGDAHDGNGDGHGGFGDSGAAGDAGG